MVIVCAVSGEIAVNVSLLHFQYFLKVSERENFSRSAEELHLSQPALSATIARLEKALHVNLFTKVGRNVRLTEEGKIVRRYALRIFESLDAMEAELAATADKAFASAKLSLPQGITIPWAPGDFFKTNPDYRLETLYLPIHEAMARIKAGTVDLVLNVGVPSEGLIAHPLYHSIFKLIMPASHPFAKQKSVSLKEMKDTPLFLPHKDLPLRGIIDTFCTEENFTPIVLADMQHSSELIHAVQSGAGIALLPVSSFTEEDVYPQTVWVPVEESIKNPLQTYLFYSATRPLSPAAQALKNHIVQQFQTL